jgi:hypothetical protein
MGLAKISPDGWRYHAAEIAGGAEDYFLARGEEPGQFGAAHERSGRRTVAARSGGRFIDRLCTTTALGDLAKYHPLGLPFMPYPHGVVMLPTT